MRDKDTLSLAMNIMPEEREENTPPTISGFGIHPGLFNGVVEVPESELDNIERTLKTAQIRNDHSDAPLNVIGKVNDAFRTFDADAKKEGVKYYGEFHAKDPNAMLLYSKIQDGYIGSSSLGFRHESICSKCGEDFHTCDHWFNEAHVIAKNCEAFEISIVSEGADSDATAVASSFSKEKFVENFKKQFESKYTKFKKGGEDMAEPTKDQSSLDTSNFVKNDDLKSLLQAKEDEITALKQTINQFSATLEDIKGTIPEAVDTGAISQLQQDNADLKLELQKSKFSNLVEKEIEFGLIAEDAREAELERLAKADEATVNFAKSAVRTMEASKQEENRLKTENENQANNAQFPPVKTRSIDEFKKEDGSIDYENPAFDQCMIQTIFCYDTVLARDGRGIEGVSYMGL